MFVIPKFFSHDCLHVCVFLLPTRRGPFSQNRSRSKGKVLLGNQGLSFISVRMFMSLLNF